MNSNAICPISNLKIDENVARFNGLFTVVLLSVFVITQNYIPIVFLLIDFFLRSAELSAYSPLATLSKYVINVFNISKKPLNAGPKIFAARIGVLFSLAILVCSVIGLETVSYILVAIFGLCAFLEAAFSFCVACQIYPILFKLTYKTKNAFL